MAFVAIAGIVAAVTVALKSGLPQFVSASIALILLIASRKKDYGV